VCFRDTPPHLLLIEHPVFQQIDIETASHPDNHRVILRMYGVTDVWCPIDLPESKLTRDKNGNSVVATVTDFLPYFYIAAPRGFRDDDIEPFKSHLNVSISYLHQVATTDLQA
jgi:DNA polymerase delta subunit 1